MGFTRSGAMTRFNGVMLLLGGMVIPLDELPGPLRTLARALPSGALAEAVRGALTDGVDIPGRAWLVLAAWAAAGGLTGTGERRPECSGGKQQYAGW